MMAATYRPARWPGAITRPRGRVSNVEEPYVLGIALDERAPRFHVLAHEHAEQLVGLGSVVERHLEQHPVRRVHRGFPQLARVHLAEPLEPLYAVSRPGVFAPFGDARLDHRVPFPVRVG